MLLQHVRYKARARSVVAFDYVALCAIELCAIELCAIDSYVETGTYELCGSALWRYAL